MLDGFIESMPDGILDVIFDSLLDAIFDRMHARWMIRLLRQNLENSEWNVILPNCSDPVPPWSHLEKADLTIHCPGPSVWG